MSFVRNLIPFAAVKRILKIGYLDLRMLPSCVDGLLFMGHSDHKQAEPVDRLR